MSGENNRPVIMLADDDIEIRRILVRALNDLDAEILEASDGEEALETIIQRQPDLVILDVMMPTLSGWELCKYIRSKPNLEHIAVLMLTAIGRTVNEMTSPLYGADAYMDKPFDIQEVLETVNKLLTETRSK